ncbi:MAG TPA: sulfatase-like hydrolase/transferase [Vicinamibacteria bacterium]|nr:sulfatase-like hydrolase/transferase [Vicinamibacteria bacterium]
MLGALLLAAAAAGPTNLVFVTIDTLRADHVGAYGYKTGQTTTLDRLAREGVLLEDAVVQAPQTRPSHASIFTGRYPFEHGLRDNYSPPLDPRQTTLAAHLKRQGFATAAFVGAYPVSRSSGLDQGFAVYDDPFGEGEGSTTEESRLERPAGQVVDAALGWLEHRPPGRFFAWVHLFDPHGPHAAPEPWKTRFPKSPYDGEVAYADAELGRLVAWLDQRDLRRSTLVIVTADHGEGLGDHGEQEHLLFLYDSTLKVPAVLSWPGQVPEGGRVKGQFRSIDWVATSLDLLGVPAMPTSGLSRAANVRQGTPIPDNESYAESLYGQLHFGWAPLRALRGEGWKHIDAPRPELYRLTEDPGELRNLIDDRPQVVTGMRARLRSLDRGEGKTATTPPVDAEAAERLAALGYVGGAFFAGTPSGDDPKDKIAWYEQERRDITTALSLYREGQSEGAFKILERLARPDKDAQGRPVRQRSFNVSYTLGRILIEKRRYADAAATLEEALQILPTATPAYAYLAQAYGGAGKPAEARAVLDRGLARAPKNPELLRARGSLRLRQGDAAGARTDLERARAANPKDALVRVDLAAIERQAGRLDAARTEAEEAVRFAPDLPEAQVALGLVEGAAGQPAKAEAAFRRALQAQGDHPDALFYLAALQLQKGQPGEAVSLLERLLQRAPRYPGASDMLRTARGLVSREP